MNKREIIDRALLAISPALSMTLLEPETRECDIYRVSYQELVKRTGVELLPRSALQH